VVPKWTAFTAAYPTPADCAAAPLGDVLRLWSGLGYPRRARDLWRAAATITHEHGGAVPADLGQLLALPGVGPYTARAVQAFAFERDVAVVDTNVARILARAGGAPLTSRRAQALADGWVPPGRGWVWNQVMIDLGATTCRPRPRCDGCPLGGSCAWARSGWPVPDPADGSAGVSRRQAPYAGSDREARGEVLRAAATGRVRRDDVRAEIVESLLRDGLLAEREGWLVLP
jgi:A/G-specific adenine glycosylase